MYFFFKVEIKINREHLIKQVYKLLRKSTDKEINQFHKCKGIYQEQEDLGVFVCVSILLQFTV